MPVGAKLLCSRKSAALGSELTAGHLETERGQEIGKQANGNKTSRLVAATNACAAELAGLEAGSWSGAGRRWQEMVSLAVGGTESEGALERAGGPGGGSRRGVCDI